MGKDKKLINNLIDFHKKAEKLKSTTRHSWLADSRQESVAEHSWMLCLLAMLLFDKLDKKIDLLKVIKMVTVHDLAESITGDIPAHTPDTSKQIRHKHQSEEKAFKILVSGLPKGKANEIMSLWREFEEKKTLEAKFAGSLDKLEAVMQHNLSDFKHWEQGDFKMQPYYKNHFFDFDSFMRKFKDIVDIQSMQKIIKAEKEHRIDKKHLEHYQKREKSRI